MILQVINLFVINFFLTHLGLYKFINKLYKYHKQKFILIFMLAFLQIIKHFYIKPNNAIIK